MITLEMMRTKKTAWEAFNTHSSWIEEVESMPTQNEINEMLKEEIEFRKSPQLWEVCLNVWEGEGDEWRKTLVGSYSMSAGNAYDIEDAIDARLATAEND